MYQRSIRARFEEIAGEYRPDHVMIGFAYPDGAAVAPLCRELGLSYSIRINGSDFNLRVRQEKFRNMVLETLKEAPQIFCPGRALKKAMVEEGIDGTKIMAFENGVDGSLFRYRGKEDVVKELEDKHLTPDERRSRVARAMQDKWTQMGKKIVLFVGNLVEVKGPDVMLEAFAYLQKKCRMSNIEYRISNPGGGIQDSEFRPSLRDSYTPILFVIGDGSMRSSLEKQAAELGVADSVRFLGSRPHGEVARWMNLADCLCLASRSEGMPNVVIEALASGLPVVATDVGGVRELLENEPEARMVKNRGSSEKERNIECRISNIECLSSNQTLAASVASALAEVLPAGIDRRAMAERNKGRFSWDKCAKEILELMKQKKDTI